MCARALALSELTTDFVTGSQGLLDARGVTAVVLDVSLAVIRDGPSSGFPGARRMIDAALAA